MTCRVGLLLHRRGRASQTKRTRSWVASPRSGELDVLVATAVVEVGVDVPNTSIVMIEGADRFGLAQLHQFRGRVGAAARTTRCACCSGPRSRARLRALAEHRDGFKLAEIDLELRGEGEMLGTRQSGPARSSASRGCPRTPSCSSAPGSRAQAILDADPELAEPEHVLLEDARRRPPTAPTRSSRSRPDPRRPCSCSVVCVNNCPLACSGTGRTHPLDARRSGTPARRRRSPGGVGDPLGRDEQHTRARERRAQPRRAARRPPARPSARAAQPAVPLPQSPIAMPEPRPARASRRAASASVDRDRAA